MTQQWNTTMKNNIETQQWHSAKKNKTVQQWNQQWNTRIKKQQFYNNHTTIFQQSKPMKHTNETRKWNTTMKNNIKHSNDTWQWKATIVEQRKQQWNKRTENQQSYNIHTTIVQQWKPMKHTNVTRKWNTTMKNNIETQ